MIGDNWKTAYEYALQNGFRFLSYGDSCLFFNQKI
jgi:S-adenosylmethionine:tRNA ribosyltransferase-isomerase